MFQSVLPFVLPPVIIFMVVVAPIWLALHYRYKSKMLSGASETKSEDIDRMLSTVDRLADRVQALEKILDHDHPNWQAHTQSGDQ